MKCKHCNGTGYNDTQRGTVMTEFPPCPWCGGSGYVKDKEQTSFEFMQSCTMEEMAEVLSNISTDAWFAGLNNMDRPVGQKDNWEQWLKQSHNRKG